MTEYFSDYKVAKFFNSDFTKDLVKIAIIKNTDGTYELFDKFTITVINKIYVVENKYNYEKIEFYSLQNAVVYCVFIQKKKYVESNRIYNLDKVLESINFSIVSLKNKIEKTKDKEYALIYSCKLTHDLAKKSKLLHELSSYKKQASYWQVTNFRA